MGDDIIYNGSRSLSRSISFSLLVHALFFFACFLLLGQRQLYVPHDRSITIELTDPLEALRKAREKSELDNQRRRIVQTAKGELVDQADKKAFLGEKNQHVDRETVSANRTTVMGEHQ